MPTTPDFLRGVAVNSVIGCIANAYAGGTWALISAETYARETILTFKVGTINPDQADERETVRITVEGP